MKAIEYVTEISPDGHFSLPPEMLQTLNLKANSTVRVLIFHKEEAEKKGLARFCGKWQDERSADEIVAEIYASRRKNNRTDGVTL